VTVEALGIRSGCFYDDRCYDENGRIQQSGGHTWIGRGGLWVAWDRDGKVDREVSGDYTAGIRFHALGDDLVRGYTDGRERLELELRWLCCALEQYRSRYRESPSSMELLLNESDWATCFPGSRALPKDP
jgi:hypothetical protein